MRIAYLKNISKEDVNLELSCGASLAIPPGAQMSDVDVVEMASLRGKVSFTEDLSEVRNASGKTQLNG